MNDSVKNVLEKVGPGTGQINLGGLVTMAMVIIAWGVPEYTNFKAPEFVWTAITGILLYAVQYWYGPNR